MRLRDSLITYSYPRFDESVKVALLQLVQVKSEHQTYEFHSQFLGRFFSSTRALNLVTLSLSVAVLFSA